MNTRTKEDIGVVSVAKDLILKGHKVAIPFGDGWDYDLVIMEPDLYKIQVKYTESNGEVAIARNRSHSVLAGRISRTKIYDSSMIDYLAIYDVTTDLCFYIPIKEIENRECMSIRLVPPKNNIKNINWFENYLNIRQ